MKWKAAIKRTPAPGETRTRTRFAWIPVRIGEAIYWLCQYDELQVLAMVQTDIIANGNVSRVYLPGKWLTVTKKAIKWIPA